MAFQPKPYVKVGKGDWQVVIPRPPKYATHADLRTDCGKNAVQPLNDFGCFRGVSGWFTYLRMDNKGKIHEKHRKKWYWNGRSVEGIEKLMKD